MNKTKKIKYPKYPCRKISNKERKNAKPVDVGKYKSLLDSLLYIAIKSRPDLTYAVNQASRNCKQPTTIDYKALLLILQYLKSTINKSIYYNRKNRLVGFSYTDYPNLR